MPGVSLLGPLLVPTHFTSAAMVSFGARPRAVLIWETIAIAVWGVAFGALAVLGLTVV